MAMVVKLGHAASVTTPLQDGGAVEEFLHSESCKLQGSIVSSRRTTQRFCTVVCSSTNVSRHRNPLLRKGAKTVLPFRAMALPLDWKSVEDGSESSAAQDGQLELEEPWLGAVIFKRSNHGSHYEFQTSLERLGLGFLSTESSKALANSMGLNAAASPAAPATTATEECTPVNISIDVSRDEGNRDLRLDGIARTTISLCCNRCRSPVVQRVFAGFNLILTEKPVVEPTQQRLGVVFGDDGPEDGGVDLDLYLNDKLYFPREAKEIDLSKYLRDTVHLEIPYKSLCSIQCAGLCLTCGVNLNEVTCNCTDVKVKPSWGPLEQLRKQLKDDEGTA